MSPLLITLVLSAVIGFLSLTQEMLWIRTIALMLEGHTAAFGETLGMFLFGIAGGSYFSQRLCERKKPHPFAAIAVMLLLAGIFYFLSIPLCATLLTKSKHAIYLAYFSVALVAFLTGGVFPLLCHYGIRTHKDVGIPTSWIYMANIVGATAGPLVTGFVLLNHYSLEQLILYVSLATVLLAWIFYSSSGVSKSRMLVGVSMGTLAAVGMVVSAGPLYFNLLEKIHLKAEYVPHESFIHKVQNRHGIVMVQKDSKGDISYGGGVYDGRFNLDPVTNENGITRPFAIPLLRKKIETVLEVGLAGGAWAKAILAHPGIKSFTAVELNHGYLEIISHYPKFASLLDDPRVTIHLDDGRRWLKRNPSEKFDLIMMNATFYWRSFGTNLLSRDFLELAKAHLNPGGLIVYNSTRLEYNFKTAAHVFNHMTRVENFVAASDTPFDYTEQERREVLRNYRIDGEKVFDESNPDSRRVLYGLAATDYSDQAPKLRARNDLWIITDDNMAAEYKYVQPPFAVLFDADRSWNSLISRRLASR